jgi:hypothetical protein
VISMVWQMLSLDSFTRQFMVLNTNQSLSEADKNKKVINHNQVKTWFGYIAFTECRKQYESGRKLKRNMLWKSQEKIDKEALVRKLKRRKVDKQHARLQTLHWLIEQQFIEGGVTLSSQLNSTSATNANLVRLCVALNNIFTHKKGDEKYSLPDFMHKLERKKDSLNQESQTFKQADTLLRRLKTEYQQITEKAAEYATKVKGATALDKAGWNLAEDFDPDVV